MKTIKLLYYKDGLVVTLFSKTKPEKPALLNPYLIPNQVFSKKTGLIT